MNREEYLAELERLLLELPEEERQAAVQYYADYFEDSGAANEAEVIRELGSPLKVAESIEPDAHTSRIYDDYYQSFKQLYPALKDSFARQAAIIDKYSVGK